MKSLLQCTEGGGPNYGTPKRSAILTNAQSRFVKVVLDAVPGLLR